MIDFERTIISQYSDSPTIVQLVRNMNDYIDPRADFDNFFNYVWNVNTAQGFGLDIWGRIVNIGRELTIPAQLQYLGFGEATSPAQPFGQAPFYVQQSTATQTYILADDAYRQLILVKALANISTTTAEAVNQLLQNMFAGRGRCYVNDLGNMALRYTFEFDLTDYELAIMTQSGALPRPAGVTAFIFQSALPLFGFAEAGESAAPFGQGVFLPQGAM